MFCLNDTMRYHLCPGRTDMRKGIPWNGATLWSWLKESMKIRHRDFVVLGLSALNTTYDFGRT